jgi:hypothetical protein
MANVPHICSLASSCTAGKREPRPLDMCREHIHNHVYIQPEVNCSLTHQKIRCIPVSRAGNILSDQDKPIKLNQES